MKINNIKLSKVINSNILVEHEYEIRHISTSSKEISSDSLFIPIIGSKFNGNDYILETIKKGVKTVLVSKDYEKIDEIIKACISNKVCLMEVIDTIDAYSLIASYYLENKDILTIGITGSNGKTTFKDMLSNVLSKKYRTISSRANFNNHIGLPKTILEVEDEEILVLEMGMNHKTEIEKLTNISKPNIRVITNIAESHIGNLGSMEDILEAKLEITSNMLEDDILILNASNKYLSNVNEYNCLKIFQEDIKIIGSKMIYKNEEYLVDSVAFHNYIYVAMIIDICKYLGFSYEELKNSFKKIELPKSRFEVSKIDNCIIVNDAYNSNFASLKAGIDEVIKLYSSNYSINLIIGDILELGEYSQYYHEEIAKYLNSLHCINKLYLVGNEVEYMRDILNIDFELVEYGVLTKMLLDMKNDDNMVYYFKASNSIGLEKIANEIKENL